MRAEFIAVLDLETTGTDESEDPILEVGIQVIRADTLENVYGFSWVVSPPKHPEWYKDRADPVVQDMHTVNGLWEECREAVYSIDQVDTLAHFALAGFLGDLRQIPLAGSGVSHFDRRFISAQMPMLDSLLTYWSYDVGAMRRILSLIGRDDLLQVFTSDKPHRALDDARLHADELRHFASVLSAPLNP